MESADQDVKKAAYATKRKLESNIRFAASMATRSHRTASAVRYAIDAADIAYADAVSAISSLVEAARLAGLSDAYADRICAISKLIFRANEALDAARTSFNK